MAAPASFALMRNMAFNDKVLSQLRSTLSDIEKTMLPPSFEEFLEVFFDNSLVFSEMRYVEHYVMVTTVFEALKRANLKISSKKTKIGVTKFTILGLKINTREAETFLNYKKASSILTWPQPASLFEVQSRLYFSKYLPKIKDISYPLISLLQSKTWKWTDIEEESWNNIKAVITCDIRLKILNIEETLHM